MANLSLDDTFLEKGDAKDSGFLEQCWDHITKNIPNEGIYKWDRRFLQMARLIASWSKDPSTKVGAVIVRPDRSILSLGFNGFPRCMRDDSHLYENRDDKLSRIVHAEVNALLFANENLKDCSLYTWPCAPCDRCCSQLLQAGIGRFVFPTPTSDLAQRWGGFELTKAYITEAGANYDEISMT